jgi:hypothetical protein
MQRRAWQLPRASRIVIVILVVQILGLGVVSAAVPVGVHAVDPGPSPAAASPDAVVPLAFALDARVLRSLALVPLAARSAAPDPVPLARRLPRAPPAA